MVLVIVCHFLFYISGARKSTDKLNFVKLLHWNKLFCLQGKNAYESGSSHTWECSSFPCVNRSHHQYLTPTDQLHTLAAVTGMVHGEWGGNDYLANHCRNGSERPKRIEKCKVNVKGEALLSLLTWVPQLLMPKKKRKSEKFKSFLLQAIL